MIPPYVRIATLKPRAPVSVWRSIAVPSSSSPKASLTVGIVPARDLLTSGSYVLHTDQIGPLSERSSGAFGSESWHFRAAFARDWLDGRLTCGEDWSGSGVLPMERGGIKPTRVNIKEEF